VFRSTDSSVCSHPSLNSQCQCSGSVRPCTSCRCGRTCIQSLLPCSFSVAVVYIREARRVDWSMNVRDERYVAVTGYAGLSIGPFNELGLEVLSSVTNVFYSEATDPAGPLNWSRNWNSSTVIWKIVATHHVTLSPLVSSGHGTSRHIQCSGVS